MDNTEELEVLGNTTEIKVQEDPIIIEDITSQNNTDNNVETVIIGDKKVDYIDLYGERQKEVDATEYGLEQPQQIYEEELNPEETLEEPTFEEPIEEEPEEIMDEEIIGEEEIIEEVQEEKIVPNIISEEPLIKEPIKKEENTENTEKQPMNYFSYTKRLIVYVGLIFILTICALGLTLVNNKLKESHKKVIIEDTNTNYSVCFKKNEHYKDECLPEGMDYLNTITDKINANFNYNVVLQESKKYNYKYYIDSTIKIYKNESDKVLYEDNKVLVKESTNKGENNVISFTVPVEIPFTKYNNIANDYLTRYGIVAKSRVDVALYIDDGNGYKKVSSLIIPLAEQTYSIEKEDTSNNKIEVIDKSKTPIVEYIITIMIVLLYLSDLAIIISFFIFIYKTSSNKSEYQKKLEEILTTYDRVIVEGKKNKLIEFNKEVYDVKNFLELLDARDTIEKPILYYKINSVKSEFYVQDREIVYRYIIKESDFEKK